MKKILFLAFSALLFIACSKDQEIVEQDGTLLEDNIDVQDDTDTDIPLVADFTFGSDVVNESDDLGITNLSTGATSYTWDFGHGNVFQDEVPDFKFLSHGIYEVTLMVRNEAGEMASVTKSIDVLCVFGGGTYGVEHSDW